MMKFRNTTLLSVVKILVILSPLYSSFSFAENSEAKTESALLPSKKQDAGSSEKKEYETSQQRIDACMQTGRSKSSCANAIFGTDSEELKKKETEKETAAACKEKREEAKDALDKIGEACKKGGFGSSCVTDIKDCDSTMGSESFSTQGLLFQALGLPSNASGSSVAQKCPQMSGKDYYEKQKEINDEIKELDKEQSDSQKELADYKEENAKLMQEVQKELREGEAELLKLKREISERKREQAAQIQEQQTKAKNDIRAKNMEMIKLEGQLVRSDRELTAKMIAFSEAAAKRQCLKNVRDQKASLKKSEGNPTNFKSAKARKSELNATYLDCMASLDQQRIATIEENRQKREELLLAIDNIKSEITDIEQTLSFQSSQLAEMQQDADKEGNEAQQMLIRQMSEAQQKMVSANQTLQERQSAIQQSIQKAQQRQNVLNNELTALGPAPSSRTSELSSSQVMADVDKHLGIALDYCESDCEGTKRVCQSLDGEYSPAKSKAKSRKGAK